MSGRTDGKNYTVGYAKPPAGHQFQKGKSGNPAGRTKGSKNKPPLLDPTAQPTDSLVLEEAYRMVTIREGDKVIELPAVQAAVRSLAISAMKGSRLAQRDLADLVQQVEDRRTREHRLAFENALEYKLRWTAELKRRQLHGSDAPDPIPHPDDIIIDMRNGHVSTQGPFDEREKVEWDKRLARREEAQSEVNYYFQKYRRCRNDERKARYLLDWHSEQMIFDLINDAMPERYKAKLENRSYRQGASREGRALEQCQKAKRLSKR